MKRIIPVCLALVFLLLFTSCAAKMKGSYSCKQADGKKITITFSSGHKFTKFVDGVIAYTGEYVLEETKLTLTPAELTEDAGTIMDFISDAERVIETFTYDKDADTLTKSSLLTTTPDVYTAE